VSLRNKKDFKEAAKYGIHHDFVEGLKLQYSGVQYCNLSTINAKRATSLDEFLKLCESAAIIGTLQAGYTDPGYLSKISKMINEKDALLGISICGWMDNPLLFNAEWLEAGVKKCIETNRKVADLIGINYASRITCVKPEGTSSLVLETSSGIHTQHSKLYIRRVQANKFSSVYNFFKDKNLHLIEKSVYNQNDDVISFLVQAQDNAITKKDLTAIEMLEKIKFVQEHWVIPGNTNPKSHTGLNHNVSCTVNFSEDEAVTVREFIWKNRTIFTGIALILNTDMKYLQAPWEEIEEDDSRISKLAPNTVDYTQLIEVSDETELKENLACAGGKCEI
jgi:ribonucleoside-diphosphate reductase alpha chain